MSTLPQGSELGIYSCLCVCTYVCVSHVKFYFPCAFENNTQKWWSGEKKGKLAIKLMSALVQGSELDIYSPVCM